MVSPHDLQADLPWSAFILRRRITTFIKLPTQRPSIPKAITSSMRNLLSRPALRMQGIAGQGNVQRLGNIGDAELPYARQLKVPICAYSGIPNIRNLKPLIGPRLE